MTAWVAYTPSGREMDVQEAYEAVGLECHVPRRVDVKRAGNRRRPDVVVSAYLPNYVFIWAADHQYAWMKDVKHVRSIMGIGPGSERAVRAFISRVESDFAARMSQIEASERVAEYNPGDLLQIITGPFAGQVARFTRMVEGANDIFPSVFASMDLMGRETGVRLDPLHVRKAG